MYEGLSATSSCSPSHVYHPSAHDNYCMGQSMNLHRSTELSSDTRESIESALIVALQVTLHDRDQAGPRLQDVHTVHTYGVKAIKAIEVIEARELQARVGRVTGRWHSALALMLEQGHFRPALAIGAIPATDIS